MNRKEPPELPNTSPPADKPIWIWALMIAAAYGIYQYTQANPAETQAHRAGYSVGSAVMLLLAAGFATLFSKKPHLPTIVSGAIVVLLMTTGNATRQKIQHIREGYESELEQRMQTWSQQSTDLQESGSCDLAVITDQKQLRRNLQLAFAAKDSTGELLAELENGEDFLSRMTDAGIPSTDASAAWSEFQAADNHGLVLKILRANDALLRSITLHLSEMDHKFGQWQVDEDGTLNFDQDVSDKAIATINQTVDDIERLSAEIQELAKGYAK